MSIERTIILSAAIACALPSLAQLVINEVDYDQQSTDTEEYIEIKNIGASLFPMQYLSVIMYNGSSGSAVEYRNIQDPSWPALGPGAYFVICTNSSATASCNHVATPTTNLIQNGPNDAIALVLTENPTPLVIDAVSYGGSLADYVEGTGTSAEDTNDSPGVSIGRFPDGQDTQDNNADFHLMCSTPGTANLIDPVQCDLSTGVRTSLPAGPHFTLLPAPDGTHVLAFDLNAEAEPLIFDLFDAKGTLLASHSGSATPRASWSIDATGLRGQLLIVRLSTPTRQESRRFVLP